MTEEINELDLLFRECERQNGILINRDGIQVYEDEHGQAQHVDLEAQEEAAIADEINAVDLTERLDKLDVTDVRRSIMEMLGSKVNVNAQRTSDYCAQLATNHNEYLDMMEHMSAKVEPPLPLTPFDVFAAAEREKLTKNGTDAPKKEWVHGDDESVLVPKPAPSLEAVAIRNWQAQSLKPLEGFNIHLPLSIECDGTDTSKSVSAMPGRAVWPSAPSVVDKKYWLNVADARNAAIGAGSTPGKLGRALQRARGRIETSRWKHPSARDRVERGIKAVKGLELARKFARSGAPKPPVAPLPPPTYSLLDGVIHDDDIRDANGEIHKKTVAVRYLGPDGRKNLVADRKALKAQSDKYPQELRDYRERRATYEKLVAARNQKLSRNKMIALDSIKYLGIHHPERGLWLRNMEPMRKKINVTFKAPSFATPAVSASTLLSRREENVTAAASNAHHHEHMNEFFKKKKVLDLGAAAIAERKKERMRIAADHAAQSAFATDPSGRDQAEAWVAAAARKEKMAVVVRAREKELEREQAMQAKIDAHLAKQKEEEAKARIPLWLKEEDDANKAGREARDKKKKDVMQRIATRQAIKDLEEEERKAMKAAAHQAKGTLARFYAQTKYLIAKARTYKESIKTRTVPTVKEKNPNSYYNIIMRSATISVINDQQLNQAFEDVEGDVSVAVRGSASKKPAKKPTKPRASRKKPTA